MKRVELIADGSAIGNPGPGGWCCILRFGDAERSLTGAEPRTTNNRMELTAAIQGLRALREPCEVRVYSDSGYLVKGMTERIARWMSAGWRGANRRPVLNQDLWESLLAAASGHQVEWHWVRGHSGINDEQERADRLARTAAREMAQSAQQRG